MFKRSSLISAIVEPHEDEFLDCYDELYDATCITGYDIDGSTGYDIFTNGVALGNLAKDKQIFVHFFEDDYVAVFFVGEENEIVAKLKNSLQE